MANPYSQFRNGWTVDEVLAAPKITKNLTKFMCSPTSVSSLIGYCMLLPNLPFSGWCCVLYCRFWRFCSFSCTGEPSHWDRGSSPYHWRSGHLWRTKSYGLDWVRDEQDMRRQSFQGGRIRGRSRPWWSRGRGTPWLFRRQWGNLIDSRTDIIWKALFFSAPHISRFGIMSTWWCT